MALLYPNGLQAFIEHKMQRLSLQVDTSSLVAGCNIFRVEPPPAILLLGIM